MNFALEFFPAFFDQQGDYTASGDLVLINYSQLPELVWARFTDHFSILLDSAAIQLMQDRSKRHSKYATEQFTVDAYQDTTQVDAAALREVEKIYDDLERLRFNQNPWN